MRLAVALGLLAALVAATTGTQPHPRRHGAAGRVGRRPAGHGPAFLIHVAYALPTGGTDRFAQLASLLATDEATIDLWWRGQDPTRTPRFDLAAVAGCTSTLGQLDVSFARLPGTAAAYAADQYHLVRRDLDAARFRDPDKKYLFYYDGPPVTGSSGGVVCRQSESGHPDGGAAPTRSSTWAASAARPSVPTASRRCTS